MTRPPGWRMLLALRILDQHGGTMVGKVHLARACGPHGSNAYGDRIVMRCVRRGYIALSGDPWSRVGYTLTLTDSGRAALAEGD